MAFGVPVAQRPAGLVEQGFAELAKRWKPILDAFDEAGVDVCYEIHPGEDLHDGASFEQFLKAVDNHPRANILSIRVISYYNSLIIWTLSIATTAALRCSMSKTLNLTPMVEMVCMAAIKTGKTERVAFAL
ncbi:hypothetical protein KUC3_02840 [Alteromonas sp. KC3]|nr:hypothetical protein KUC3_02840 [Alteromonas sp. KC3]